MLKELADLSRRERADRRNRVGPCGTFVIRDALRDYGRVSS